MDCGGSAANPRQIRGGSAHSFGKIAPFVHLQKFFSKTASRAVINVKFEQKSASRAEVKHKNGLKTILFQKILGRTHFKHVFRNYEDCSIGRKKRTSAVCKTGDNSSSVF